MKQFGYVLTRELQARQIGSLVREAARFASSIRLGCGEQQAELKDARVLYGQRAGSRLTVMIDGRDEEAAVAAIQNYVVANM